MAKLGLPEIPLSSFDFKQHRFFFLIPSLTMHCDFSLSLNGS